MIKVTSLLTKDTQKKIQGKSLATLLKAQKCDHLWSDRKKVEIDTIVFHYISAIEFYPRDPFSVDSIIEVLCHFGVSSHYLIDRSGACIQLVPEENKAWHCGGSIMPPPDLRESVNEFSLGVELAATKDSGFTNEQYQTLAQLAVELESRWAIKTYTGHENIAGEEAVKRGLRKDIKVDPGPLFDWERFYTLKKAV